MSIPFVDLAPVTQLVAAEALARWQTTLAQHQFLSGPQQPALEQALADWLGTAHCVATNNGTQALMLALAATGVGPGSVVAMPALTFWATYEAIAQLGAAPVLIDIDPDDLQMSFAQLTAAHETHRFRHVVLVHLMGWASAATAEFRTWCRTRDIVLVEDAAQAAGVRLGAAPLLADAHIATLSFFPAKVLGTCGDGGAVVTRDAGVAAEVRLLANHGRTGHYAHSRVGWNARMSGLAADYLLALLPHADAIVAARVASLTYYQRHLPAGMCHHAPAGVTSNGYLCAVACADPVAAASQLGAMGIGTGRIYPSTIADQAPARATPRYGELPHARAFVKRVLNLPLYFGLDVTQQGRVVTACTRVFHD